MTGRLYGIEHLTKDESGNVYWRGNPVEQFEDLTQDEEIRFASGLETVCLIMEKRGIEPVKSNHKEARKIIEEMQD